MIDRILSRVEAIAIAALIASISGVVVVNVFSRYAFNFSIAVAEEVARYMLVWLSMLAMPAGFRHGLHTGVDICVKNLPARAQAIVRIFVDGFMVIAFGFIVIVSIDILMSEYAQDLRSSSLRIPLWMVTSAVPVGSMLCCLRILQLIRLELVYLRR